MTKKAISLFVATAVLGGFFAVGTPMTAYALKKNPDTDATITVTRPTGKSMVLSMSEVGTIFQNRYPNAALHSIELSTKDLKYNYKIVGYTLTNTITMNVDIISGKTTKDSIGGKTKDIALKIFNKDKIIQPAQAESAAIAAVGTGAVSKGWKVEADNGEVTYYVTIHQDGKITIVQVNAKTGEYLSQSKAVELPPEPEYQPSGSNIIFGEGK